MKVLLITHKPVFPKIDGGCVASANFLNLLLKMGVDVKYLTISTDKHPFYLADFPSDIAQQIEPEHIYINTAVRPFEAFNYLLKNKSYNIDRFYNPEMEANIVRLISQYNFDSIILDSLYTTPYFATIKSIFKGKVFLRAHNIEFKLWEDIAHNAKNKLKKNYFKRLAKDLKKFELDILAQVDGILSLSQEDIRQLNELNITTTNTLIPVTIPVTENKHDYSKNNLFHLGAMNWQPNIEAVEKMISLMPAIRKKLPSLEFHIAGNTSEISYNDPVNGIVDHGFVSDLNRFVQSQGILVSPIISGSGIRVKILEMMAMGVPVITTSLGASGITMENNMLIANSDEALMDAVYQLTNDENYRRKLGENAVSYIKLHHNPETVGKQLIEFIESI